MLYTIFSIWYIWTQAFCNSCFVARDRFWYKQPLVARIWTTFERQPPSSFILLSGYLASPKWKPPPAWLSPYHLLILFTCSFSVSDFLLLSASFLLKSWANLSVFELINFYMLTAFKCINQMFPVIFISFVSFCWCTGHDDQKLSTTGNYLF